MEAKALTPRDLFDGKVCYEVPPFQRPYVWSEEDQWQPLWDDIERVTEAQLHGDGDKRQDAASPSHFLGAGVACRWPGDGCGCSCPSTAAMPAPIPWSTCGWVRSTRSPPSSAWRWSRRRGSGGRAATTSTATGCGSARRQADPPDTLPPSACPPPAVQRAGTQATGC